jgi:hypothetical protein
VLPKGSSGSWVISADRTKVYGVIAATDCFGDLWMVRMIDIMKDIQEEFDAVKVAFVSHIGPAGTERATTHVEVGQDSPSLDSMERLISSMRDMDFPVLEDFHEEEADSLDEHPMEDEVIAHKDQSSGSTPHAGPHLATLHHFWPIEERETPVSLYAPSATEHTHLTRSRCLNCTTEETGGPKEKNLVWFCGMCSDGPYGNWQVSCQSCGHARCG